MNLKRKFDKMMAEGEGKQLLWLLVIVAACVCGSLLIANFILDDGSLSWQDVVALFLDAGCFGGAGAHDWFRLCLAMLSTFLFSALLVSMFTNVFENIAERVREGERRYQVSGHVLILGAGHQLQELIDALAGSGKTVVVMSEAHPEVQGDYIYYKGSRDSEHDLASARPHMAEILYIIGDDDEADHDSRSLCCLELLECLCAQSAHRIHAYVTVKEHVTTEVMQCSKQKPADRRLMVEVINEHEYQAEQLLVNTPFLPVMKRGDARQAQFFLVGTHGVAQAVADTLAHVCHYPNYEERGVRAVITFIGEDTPRLLNALKAARPALFAMSHHRLLYADGRTTDFHPQPWSHLPESHSDFLDIEWHFVEGDANSPMVRKLMCDACTDGYATRVIVCEEEAQQAVEAVLRLPRPVYDEAKIAVYMREKTHLLQWAIATGRYGQISLFGPSSETNGDPLYLQRPARGQRVNYIYARHYAEDPAKVGNAETEWYRKSEADKHSSIYCATAMCLLRQCYGTPTGDEARDRAIYEAEHRRWMMSELLMGFTPGKHTDKRRFIHADILPFSLLSPEEQLKDKLLIDHMDYIINGTECN